MTCSQEDCFCGGTPPGSFQVFSSENVLLFETSTCYEFLLFDRVLRSMISDNEKYLEKFFLSFEHPQDSEEACAASYKLALIKRIGRLASIFIEINDAAFVEKVDTLSFEPADAKLIVQILQEGEMKKENLFRYSLNECACCSEARKDNNMIEVLLMRAFLEYFLQANPKLRLMIYKFGMAPLTYLNDYAACGLYFAKSFENYESVHAKISEFYEVLKNDSSPTITINWTRVSDYHKRFFNYYP